VKRSFSSDRLEARKAKTKQESYLKGRLVVLHYLGMGDLGAKDTKTIASRIIGLQCLCSLTTPVSSFGEGSRWCGDRMRDEIR
jgi:hypothetical protein